jgi:hypothetical protein
MAGSGPWVPEGRVDPSGKAASVHHSNGPNDANGGQQKDAVHLTWLDIRRCRFGGTPAKGAVMSLGERGREWSFSTLR